VPNPGDPRSWDRFAYALNNPLKYIDPSGHRNCEEDGYNCWPGDTGGGTNGGNGSSGGTNNTGGGSSNSGRPPVVLTNQELQFIAVDIMAETSNGGFPAWTFEIHAWVLLNRAARGITYWTGAMKDLMDKGETQFDAAIRWLKNCYLSSAACPVMSTNFNVVFEAVNETYSKYTSGRADPTHGGLFFSHAEKLEREGKKFANYSELKTWLTENAEWYKNKHPEWDYYISEPFLYQTYSQAGWRFASSMVIIVTGNEFSGSCTPYSSCGAHR
jgi:hypothetical protein